MEAWILVKNNIKIIVLLLLIVASQSSNSSEQPDTLDTQQATKQADKYQQIRFYKINKHQQMARVRFIGKKSKQAGCHNFITSPRVYKAVQIGYQSCHLYTKKNCGSDSIIKVRHKKSDIASNTLTEGYGWTPEGPDNGLKIRSWSCQ